jgi:aryl-alcohol dehydrogenase-like predicted oxidoreductase
MESKQVTRREFIRDSAVVAAGVAVGLGAVSGKNAQAGDKTVDTSKIINYNPNMEYRRQGKTNLMVSAVCLGGHSGSDNKERYEIVSRCIDVGINYIDACTGGEVRRDAKALKGRRDKMYIGFSNINQEPRREDYRTAKKMMEGLDNLLKAANLEYADLWRITCLEPSGRHTFNTSCEIAKVLEKAKKQGKVRFGGFSAHDRRWIKFMIEYFPQIDCVCFPFTTMTKAAPKDSLFAALKKCDVGAFGIKPFAASSLFKGNREEDDRRARLAIRYILHSNTVIPIPGLNDIRHVENVAKAVMERRELDLKERAELGRAGKEMWAKLPTNYQWLKEWEYV